MKIKRYTCERKFEDETFDWCEKYPQFGASDWTEENYFLMDDIPCQSGLEFPSLVVYEKSQTRAPKDLPNFLCIFSSAFSFQEVVLDGIVDVIDMINYVLPIFNLVESMVCVKKMDK